MTTRYVEWTSQCPVTGLTLLCRIQVVEGQMIERVQVVTARGPQTVRIRWDDRLTDEEKRRLRPDLIAGAVKRFEESGLAATAEVEVT